MARNVVGIPYVNPTRYVGPYANLIPIVKVPREPTTSDSRYPLGQFWIVGDNPTNVRTCSKPVESRTVEWRDLTTT